jgi:microcin C transport system ATP-binding protein
MFKGEDLLDNDEDDLRRVRGNDITMIFQEPMTSLNPLHTVERQIGEILALHQGLSPEDAARKHTGAARQGGHPRCRKPPRGLSAPAFGRAAAAGDDCHGAGQQPRNC